MKQMLERMWNEYFYEECAKICDAKEKEALQRAAKMRESVSAQLTKEQSEAVEKYVEALYENQIYFAKRSFFKGCEFAISFLFDLGRFA